MGVLTRLTVVRGEKDDTVSLDRRCRRLTLMSVGVGYGRYSNPAKAGRGGECRMDSPKSVHEDSPPRTIVTGNYQCW